MQKAFGQNLLSLEQKLFSGRHTTIHRKAQNIFKKILTITVNEQLSKALSESKEIILLEDLNIDCLKNTANTDIKATLTMN